MRTFISARRIEQCNRDGFLNEDTCLTLSHTKVSWAIEAGSLTLGSVNYSCLYDMFMLECFLMGSSWNFRYETLRPYIHIHQNREHRIDIQTSSFLQVNNEFLEIQRMGIIQCVIFLKKHQEISLNKEVEDFKGFEDEARNGMNVDAYR